MQRSEVKGNFFQWALDQTILLSLFEALVWDAVCDNNPKTRRVGGTHTIIHAENLVLCDSSC